LNARTQALIARAVLGIVLVELPILTLELSKPNPDYRLLALGLLGGLAAYLDKLISPQLADTYLSPRGTSPDPLTTVLTMPPTSAPVMPPPLVPPTP
jgi:hypothetical protein